MKAQFNEKRLCRLYYPNVGRLLIFLLCMSRVFKANFYTILNPSPWWIVKSEQTRVDVYRQINETEWPTGRMESPFTLGVKLDIWTDCRSSGVFNFEFCSALDFSTLLSEATLYYWLFLSDFSWSDNIVLLDPNGNFLDTCLKFKKKNEYINI